MDSMGLRITGFITFVLAIACLTGGNDLQFWALLLLSQLDFIWADIKERR